MLKKVADGAGKRVPLNMRTTQDLRSKLDAAAAASGRSLAQEVELRLERSFDAAADQRAIIREEVRAAFMDHEADLAVARVRRSAALEELARLDGESFFSDIYNGKPSVVRVTGAQIGRDWRV